MGFLSKLYPHMVRKARPVTAMMVHQAVDVVEVLQLPLLQLEDGPWLEGVRLDRLRNSTWLQLLAGLGRRAGHIAPLCMEHLRFQRVELLGDRFMLTLQVHMPLGKGALQSHQTVPMMSRVDDSKADAVETAKLMKHDVVMLLLLLAYFMNATTALSWADAVQPPQLKPSRGQCPVLPQLSDRGLPTGHPWQLGRAQQARFYSAHAGCWLCRLHGAWSAC